MTAAFTSHTRREINQQPEVWEQVLADVEAARADLAVWLNPLLARPDLRIILTGAGSSAYAGVMLAPALSRGLQRTVEAISTTSIVGSPADHLIADRPTLVISYARSGNSPESLATVELADALIADCHHLVICCDPESALARGCEGAPNRRLFALPPASLDQSFAMTSGLSSMLVSTLQLLLPNSGQIGELARQVRILLNKAPTEIEGLVHGGFNRLIFIGSGVLQGIAIESALKVLELSAGRIVAMGESALGFRHGPKFLIDGDTVVVVMPSSDPYTRQYDLDLFAELDKEKVARQVIRLDRIPGLDGAGLEPQWLGLAYLTWCQMLACTLSESFGINPDNPCPTGELNRVVQGFSIHPYAAGHGL